MKLMRLGLSTLLLGALCVPSVFPAESAGTPAPVKPEARPEVPTQDRAALSGHPLVNGPAAKPRQKAEIKPSGAQPPALDCSLATLPSDARPARGSGRIIDSKGRVNNLQFGKASRALDADAWFERMEVYDRERSSAREKDEALRLQWIADERERAYREAERQAAQQAAARQWPSYDTAFWMGGGSYGPVRPPRRHKRSASRPAATPLQPIFLPAPNLTSPFPHSRATTPGAPKSFLP